MTTIQFHGTTYHCPHADLIPRHTAEERQRLDENAAFAYPVLVYRDTTLDLDNCVLDGHGRLGSASRTGSAVEFLHLGEMTTEEARDLAERIENDRRHETPETIRARRERRVKRVAELRAEGKSIRAIADEVGVSPGQVQRDIQDSGVSPDTPESVTGTDGKTYPASKPTPPDPDEWDSWEPEEEADAPPPQDDTPPQPAIDASPKDNRAPWMTGGNHLDPDHPYYDLLTKFSALSAAVTAAVRNPDDPRLYEALKHLSFVVRKTRMIEHKSTRIEGDEVKGGGFRFVGLGPLRAVIRLAGMRVKPLTLKQVAGVFDEVNDSEGADTQEAE